MEAINEYLHLWKKKSFVEVCYLEEKVRFDEGAFFSRRDKLSSHRNDLRSEIMLTALGIKGDNICIGL